MDDSSNGRAARNPKPAIELEFTGAARLRTPALMPPELAAAVIRALVRWSDLFWFVGVNRHQDRHRAHRHAARHERARSTGAGGLRRDPHAGDLFVFRGR
jgi:hypothetical protein